MRGATIFVPTLLLVQQTDTGGRRNLLPIVDGLRVKTIVFQLVTSVYIYCLHVRVICPTSPNGDSIGSSEDITKNEGGDGSTVM